MPGFQWHPEGTRLVLAGMSGTPTLAALHWWTNRGVHTSDQRTEEAGLLQRCMQRWGQRVCHIFDQSFAGSPWLSLLFAQEARFILRWPGRYKLADVAGCEQKAWQVVRGKRAWDHRLLWDARRHCFCKTGVLAVPVLSGTHSLVLVVARRGAGQPPWYLLTNDPVADVEELWRIHARQETSSLMKNP